MAVRLMLGRTGRGAAAIAVASALGLATAASAGVVVSPVIVELSPTTRVGSVMLRNNGEAPVIIQASGARWIQRGGADAYEESHDLLVAPAIVEIAPGGSQVFRVTLRGQFPKTGEQAFRLHLEDVTPPEAQSGIALRVRHDLPVMVAAAPGGKPAPRMISCPPPAPRGCVQLHNDGDRRFKVTSVSAEASGWRQAIRRPSTVLSGAWRQWSFEPPIDSGPVTVTAKTAAGDIRLRLRAASP